MERNHLGRRCGWHCERLPRSCYPTWRNNGQSSQLLWGAVGSGLAVISSLWLEKRKRARGLEQMMLSLVTTASVAMRFSKIDDKQMAAMVITFQQSAAAFEASRLGATIEDPIHQYAFQSALFWLKRALTEMENCMRDFSEGRIAEAKFAEVCRSHAVAIIKPVEDFLERSGLPEQPFKTFNHLKELTEGCS